MQPVVMHKFESLQPLLGEEEVEDVVDKFHPLQPLNESIQENEDEAGGLAPQVKRRLSRKPTSGDLQPAVMHKFESLQLPHGEEEVEEEVDDKDIEFCAYPSGTTPCKVGRVNLCLDEQDFEFHPLKRPDSDVDTEPSLFSPKPPLAREIIFNRGHSLQEQSSHNIVFAPMLADEE